MDTGEQMKLMLDKYAMDKKQILYKQLRDFRDASTVDRENYKAFLEELQSVIRCQLDFCKTDDTYDELMEFILIRKLDEEAMCN